MEWMDHLKKQSIEGVLGIHGRASGGLDITGLSIKRRRWGNEYCMNWTSKWAEAMRMGKRHMLVS